MMVLGAVLLIVGFLVHIPILVTIGIVVLIIGAVLLLVGGAHPVGGRRYWY